MKIGLLVPTAFECEALPDLGLPLIRGTYGPGKAAASAAMAQLIHVHQVDAVLIWGLAGGVAPQVKIGDVVVASAVAYHDYDISPLMGATGVGEAPGFSIGNPWVSLDDELAAVAHAHLRLAMPDQGVHLGQVASGDRFVQLKHPEDRNAILSAALAVEMEGAAAAHVCALHAAHGGQPVRVCMVRIVSDSADGAAHFDFAETAKALHALNRGVLPGLVAALRGTGVPPVC